MRADLNVSLMHLGGMMRVARSIVVLFALPGGWSVGVGGIGMGVSVATGRVGVAISTACPDGSPGQPANSSSAIQRMGKSR